MSSPLISVVMAVYNGENELPPTIESLRRQTLHNFELIIVDDDSTDQTWEYLSHLEFPRLRVHRNATKKGQTISLNLALKMAQGQYVARHDTEDTSLPERFEKQVAFLESRPDVAMVGSQVDWVDAAGDLVHHFDYPTGHKEIVEHLKTKNCFVHGAVMARRSVLTEMDGYREAFRLAQEYDLWLRVTENHKVANQPEVLYKMRFSARMACVRRSAEQGEYAQLARQLAAERTEHGKEKTDVNIAGDAIADRYARMNPFARQIERAANYVNWAERLLWWGGPADQYTWAIWTYALTAWPFNLRIWKFAARQLLQQLFRPGPDKS